MPDAAHGYSPLRARAEWADRAARTVMRRPSLYSVVVAFDDPVAPVYVAHCGFQQERRRWWGRSLLDVCQVEVGVRPESAVVRSHGTYGRHQYRALAAIKEHPFPRRALDLSDLAVEPGEARDRMTQLVMGTGRATPRCSGLALTLEQGRLAWRGAVDVPSEGIHTLAVDAMDGRVILSKFDGYAPG